MARAEALLHELRSPSAIITSRSRRSPLELESDFRHRLTGLNADANDPSWEIYWSTRYFPFASPECLGDHSAGAIDSPPLALRDDLLAILGAHNRLQDL